MGTYTFTKQVPLKLFLGLFNGSGINNPSWNNKINIIGRVEFGRAEGFRAAASYYNGSAPRHAFVVERDGVSSQEELNQKMNMVGAELHYVTGGFFIEGEYARRYLKTKVDNDDILNTTMTAALIHSYYRFEMPRRFVMSYIAPMVQQHGLPQHREHGARNRRCEQDHSRDQLRLRQKARQLGNTPQLRKIFPQGAARRLQQE